MSKERILIIDQLNIFLQSWIVNPTISGNGIHIGALFGSLRSLSKLIRENKPTRIIIVWDGEGGSRKRRSWSEDYKKGRKPLRRNYEIPGVDKEESIDNKIWQQVRLSEYYNCMPVEQYVVKGSEADDVIAYIVKSKELRGIQKIIVSTDRDFIQLLNEETILYRPVKKEYLNSLRVTQNEHIHPENWAVAKAIVGDNSDNVKGVPGIGWKKLVKHFDFISGSQHVLLSDIISYARERVDEAKVYQSVSESEEIIKNNYKLVNLSSPLISAQDAMGISEALQTPDKTFDSISLIEMMKEDQMPLEKLIELVKQMRELSK